MCTAYLFGRNLPAPRRGPESAVVCRRSAQQCSVAMPDVADKLQHAHKCISIMFPQRRKHDRPIAAQHCRLPSHLEHIRRSGLQQLRLFQDRGSRTSSALTLGITGAILAGVVRPVLTPLNELAHRPPRDDGFDCPAPWRREREGERERERKGE